jgi:hypothetical protein
MNEPKQRPYWLKGLADGHSHQLAHEATHDPVLAHLLDLALVARPGELYEALVAAARVAVLSPQGSGTEQEALAQLAYLLASQVDHQQPNQACWALTARAPEKPTWHERLVAGWLGLRYGLRLPRN